MSETRLCANVSKPRALEIIDNWTYKECVRHFYALLMSRRGRNGFAQGVWVRESAMMRTMRRWALTRRTRLTHCCSVASVRKRPQRRCARVPQCYLVFIPLRNYHHANMRLVLRSTTAVTRKAQSIIHVRAFRPMYPTHPFTSFRFRVCQYWP